MIQYWPDKGSNANFGPLTVRCLTEDESVPGVIIRTFQLSSSHNKVIILKDSVVVIHND